MPHNKEEYFKREALTELYMLLWGMFLQTFRELQELMPTDEVEGVFYKAITYFVKGELDWCIVTLQQATTLVEADEDLNKEDRRELLDDVYRCKGLVGRLIIR